MKEAMMFNRILGVFKLDVNTFEEIERDSGATMQAAVIVAIVAFLAAVGSGIGASIGGSAFFTSFITSLVWVFVGWLLWSLVTYIVGTMLFGGKASMDEMLRVIGFAYAPQFLSIIPCIGWFIGILWSLAAGFIAVRQGLDLDNMKALLTIVVGFIVYLIGTVLITSLTGGIGNLLG
jgi:hypothetical protein